MGGKQVRPNIHIDDITDLYIHLINKRDDIESGCFNAGFENISISEIANLIKTKLSCDIKLKESNDPEVTARSSK